jgi:cytoskeletal protein RodZ
MIAQTEYSNAIWGLLIFFIGMVGIFIMMARQHSKEKMEAENINESEVKSSGEDEEAKDKFEASEPLTEKIVLHKDRDELILDRLTSIDMTLKFMKWPVGIACVCLIKMFISSFSN